MFVNLMFGEENNGNPCTGKTSNKQKTAKKQKEVQIMSLAVGHIHSGARGGRGDEEDDERGSCRAQWVITTGQFLSIITPLRCVRVAMRQRGIIHSIVIDCPVSVCSPC